MDEYEYEKYVTNGNGKSIKETIEKYGVAVVPNVLNEEECGNMVDGMWKYFEHISQDWETPVDRNNKDTWRGVYSLFPLHGMLFQHFNCGHSQASWDLRQNPKIVKIFAEIWECTPEELLVSFDGFSFGLPPEETKKGWCGTWYHTDQSFMRPEFECIQSWVTGLDVAKGDATLGFMEASNTYHEEFAETFGVTSKHDWYKLNKEEEKFYSDKGCEYKRIKCPKGSMVFWDSRTIHCGVSPCKTRENSDLRSVIYLCYQPRKLISNANLKKKKEAFENMRTTSHYPCKPKLFAKYPRTYGRPVPEINVIDEPKLTPLGKKLAGF
jgi:ectoine hydroxylase-related dioxygenase (phytanoyl-CoA dioxygenase family)